jgi:hypothetical protein
VRRVYGLWRLPSTQPRDRFKDPRGISQATRSRSWPIAVDNATRAEGCLFRRRISLYLSPVWSCPLVLAFCGKTGEIVHAWHDDAVSTHAE